MKNRNKRVSTLDFRTAVRMTLDITNCYQPGLKALGADSKKINLSNTSQCQGSVFIDSCVQTKYVGENRWDYAFSYKSEVFFIEVHTASTGEVSTVLKKLEWLKRWLVDHANELNRLRAKSQSPYIWIQSDGFHILKNSPQYRRVIQAGLRPISKLALNY